MSMAGSNVAVASKKQVARPLKILIPLIQSDLQMGNSVAREYYIQAGEKLIEAKDQVPYGRWSRWLADNFELSRSTAARYMQWARTHNDLSPGAPQPPDSLREMRGDTQRDREKRQSTQQKAFDRVLRGVARDSFVQERQARDDEIRLHRELAEELIDIGYRALATRLHPDRGGSKDAMSRLNRVRDELKQMAQTRRYI